MLFIFCFFFPQRVACLLRKVVQEIERRISTQAEHLRTVIYLLCFFYWFLLSSPYQFFSIGLCLQQNNLFKSREEKYQSRIRVLETLATGTNDENQVLQICCIERF